mmetsp:Transcript_18477/g.56472  ORF Transcript_18477/g.56472 Transcript_18477/m.56472 type:complete len:217 (-) Transcript_18477:156-806(-)
MKLPLWFPLLSGWMFMPKSCATGLQVTVSSAALAGGTSASTLDEPLPLCRDVFVVERGHNKLLSDSRAGATMVSKISSFERSLASRCMHRRRCRFESGFLRSVRNCCSVFSSGMVMGELGDRGEPGEPGGEMGASGGASPSKDTTGASFNSGGRRVSPPRDERMISSISARSNLVFQGRRFASCAGASTPKYDKTTIATLTKAYSRPAMGARIAGA